MSTSPHFSLHHISLLTKPHHFSLPSEVILSVIVPKFKVTEAENTKDVFWNLSSVRYPSVGKNTKPALPVQMERIRDSVL